MKFLRHIILILMMFLACSCIDEDIKDRIDTLKPGDKVEVDVSVNLPGDGAVYTKALGENPEIKSLYLAVFDEAGYLVEYVKAQEKKVEQNGVTNQKAYTVALTLSNAKRIIHFIANNTEVPKYGTEVESIGSLTTTDKWDVYWQRTVLENGIQLQADGQTITDETKNALNNIGLIRNFAKLTMSSEATGFEPISFFVVNERTIGSIAPYNTNSGSFVENYKGYTSLQALQDIGYDGFIPKNSPLSSSVPATTAEFDEVATRFGDASNKYANYHYLYERETPLDFKTQPYIIVKGNYGGEGPFYYKISFNSYEGKAFPFLRNFNYGITIKSVNRKGSATPLLASTSTGSGDISTSIDPTIINISDGTQRLFVSFTDTLLVTNNEIKFRYKYIPDLSTGISANGILADPANAQNSGVYFNVVDGLNNTVTANTMVGSVIEGYTVADKDDDNDGYRTVTLQINGPQNFDLKEYVLISGQRINGGTKDILSRKISYTLRQKQQLKVVCDPSKIESKKGTPITVKIGIPAGLGESQFPMDIAVEALGLTLTPNNDNLPVQTGKSTALDGSTVGKPAFWFIRTVTWDEYDNAQANDGYKYVDCHFKSNTAESASGIVASNKYFDQGKGSFENYTASQFQNCSISGSFQAYTEKPVTLSFSLPALPGDTGNVDDDYVYIALDGAEPADDNLKYFGTVTINDKKLAQYRYKPNDLGTQSFKLITTDDNTGKVTAYLSAYHYTSATVEKRAKIWFYFGDDMYIGTQTNGMAIGQQSRIVWYVHFENFQGTNVGSTTRKNYTSTVSFGSTTLKGYATGTKNIGDETYIEFVSSNNSDSDNAAFFQERTVGTHIVTFSAKDNSNNVGDTEKTFIVREPYFYITLPADEWYSVNSGIVKAYVYSELDYPDDIELPITGQWEVGRPRPKKTTETKNINGLEYTAYTAIWSPGDNRGTLTGYAIAYIPGTGTKVESNIETVTIAKGVRNISADDIAVKIKETGTISVSGNDGTGRTLSFSSSNSDIISLNGANFTANKKGTATITITAAENDQYYEATTTINAKVSLKTLAITANNLTINDAKKGSTGTITVNNLQGRTLTASSSNTNQATVSIAENKVTVYCEKKPDWNLWGSYATVTVTITAAENDEYDKSEITVTVTMNR